MRTTSRFPEILIWTSLVMNAQPSVIYVNLAHFPVDQYDSGNGLYPGCSTFGNPLPVRTCFQQFFAQVRSRGVTGVRLMFSFCGGGASTPLNCSSQAPQSPNSSWLSNIDLLFLDLKNNGIDNVVLTPTFYGQPADQYTVQVGSDTCLSPAPDVRYKYFHAAPFPVLDANNYPAGQGINDAYNCVPSNPYFVGWQNLYNVIDATLQKAQNRALSVTEVDVQQELDFVDFTVLARTIYDNKHGASGNPNVLDSVRYYLNSHLFNGDRVTYSTTLSTPRVGSSPQTDCGSVYGDSARMMLTSSFFSAIGGGVIGVPSSADTSQGLWCGGNSSNMLPFGTYHTPPSVIDIHLYASSPTGMEISDIEPSAAYDYVVVNALIQSYNNGWRGYVPNVANSVILFGEVSDPPNPAIPNLCSGDPKNAPQAIVNAFNSIANPLKGRTVGGSGGVIFAPWFQPLSNSYSYAPWPSSSSLSPYTPPIPGN